MPQVQQMLDIYVSPRCSSQVYTRLQLMISMRSVPFFAVQTCYAQVSNNINSPHPYVSYCIGFGHHSHLSFLVGSGIKAPQHCGPSGRALVRNLLFGHHDTHRYSSTQTRKFLTRARPSIYLFDCECNLNLNAADSTSSLNHKGDALCT